ncbi:FeoC-like transcriptional regulator [Aliiroseovarius crassostreae]|uniref:FeoC-like transcriptional regulator n=1 Tax=Aliiroseovarius crassostreae TaxID=154981 RepID=UPI003C7A8B06
MAMLLDIRQYIEDHETVSLLDLSHRFHISPDALRGMLAHWQRKGVIRRKGATMDCGGCTPSPSCGGCNNLAAFETYERVGDEHVSKSICVSD